MRPTILLSLVSIGAIAMASPASAQPREIEYPRGSLGYEALVASDYQRAEQQLRADNRVHHNDPARLLNYGLVLAKTGRMAEARKLFEQTLAEDEVELILADGETLGSHEVARRGLRMTKASRQ
jgi:tetratricopeptide (TPR) repeat protein